MLTILQKKIERVLSITLLEHPVHYCLVSQTQTSECRTMNGGPEVNKPCRDWFFGPGGIVTTENRCNKDDPPSHPLCKQLHEEMPETKEFYTNINNGTEKVNEDPSDVCIQH